MTDDKNLSSFEKKVLSGLALCGLNPSLVSNEAPLGLAVSGGADSMSLLLSLSNIFPPALLKVITVDHGIRSEEESSGDAEFVKSFCQKKSIFCQIYEIPQGKIFSLAQERKRGVEEAARYQRYQAFNQFIEKYKLSALCLAHNQNDMLETLLMRFLQGGGSETLGGIAFRRGKIIRPLLKIPRNQIEEYLTQNNLSWRTDATNFDTKYLRNKIRNQLIPLLEENFEGWQKNLLTVAKKSFYDDEILSSLTQKKVDRVEFSPESFKIPAGLFFEENFALQRRIFYSCLNKIGFDSRFPFRLFEEISEWNKKNQAQITFENLKVTLKDGFIQSSLVKENESQKIWEGFSYILTGPHQQIQVNSTSLKSLPLLENDPEEGKVLVKNGEKSLEVKIKYPCLVRSLESGDRILDSKGRLKKVTDILSNWKIKEKDRSQVIIIELLEKGSEPLIKALLAFPISDKNWIVEDSKLG